MDVLISKYATRLLKLNVDEVEVKVNKVYVTLYDAITELQFYRISHLILTAKIKTIVCLFLISKYYSSSFLFLSIIHFTFFTTSYLFISIFYHLFPFPCLFISISYFSFFFNVMSVGPCEQC